MDNNRMLTALIVGVFVFALWIIGLIFAFVPTVIVTLVFVIIGGVLTTSGGGDNRTLND